jgi:hypothetical protein
MGTWGYKSFENDYALDWVDELLENGGVEPITEALDAVLELEDEQPEATGSSMAIAAAEVVAALAGKPATELPEDLNQWIANQKGGKPGLLKKAQRALKKVLQDSELKDLWAENDRFPLWQAEVDNLLTRLNSEPG